MSSCKNCFAPIEDLRSAVRCSTCSSALHKECAVKDGGTFYCDVCYTVALEKKTACQTDIQIPEVIRRSHIELYKSCPYAFYLEVIKKVPTTCSSFAQIGIDLHDLFYRACLGNMSKKYLTQTYRNIWEANYTDELFEADLHLYKDMNVQQLRDKLWQQSLDAIDAFFEMLPTLPQNAFALEKTLELSVGDDLPKISITMDRIDEIDGELEVHDWKTGTVMVGKKLSSDLQAPLYIKTIQSHYNMPVRRFIFHYLSENKTRTFERIDDDNYVCTVNKREYFINLTDAIREVQHIFSQIKNGQFNIPRNTRKMYFTCKTCSYSKSGTCQGADIEGWKQYNRGRK